MRNILLFVIFIFSVNFGYSQELNCSVQVSSQQISSSDKQIFTTLQTALNEFMNNRKWTNNVFKNEERIECSILLNISEYNMGSGQMKGTIQVQSRRPVFNSSYSTTIFNTLDKDLDFVFIDGQPFDYSDNAHLNNLSSIMAYYAYIIIGLDYDSFSLSGGQPYFDKAQTIVNNAQSAAEKGWKSFESQKNRYWIVENLVNSNYKTLRESMYKYHRTGLDIMSDKNELGRNTITQVFDQMLVLKRSFPNIYFFQIFFTAKSDEIANMYSKAPAGEKTTIIKTLNELDPGNVAKYKKIAQP